MRKLIGGTLMSLNGVIGNPHEWAGEYFDEAAAAEALEQLRRTDAMLMGRRTYEIFARLWPSRTGPYPDAINAIRKYVFSSSLETAEWENATVVRGDPVAAVRELKAAGDGDLVMYGHGQLGRALLEHGLIDELKVWVHPRFVPSGRLMFDAGQETRLQHAETRTLATGVVLLGYRPRNVIGEART